MPFIQRVFTALINRSTKNVFTLLIILSKPFHVPHYSNKNGLCSLVSHSHIYQYVLTVKTFFYFSKLSLPVVAVSDGTLSNNDIAFIRKHIVNIKIFSGIEATRIVEKKISRFSNCVDFRKTGETAKISHNKKLFDPILLSNFKRFILIDSDILFYQKPTALIEWIETRQEYTMHMGYITTQNKKPTNEMSWEETTLTILNKIWPCTTQFNSGFICSSKAQFNLQRINTIIKQLQEFSIIDKWFSEQFVFAILFAQEQSTKLLNTHEYLIASSHIGTINNRVCVHYDTPARTMLYTEGIKLLLSTKLLYANFR